MLGFGVQEALYDRYRPDIGTVVDCVVQTMIEASPCSLLSSGVVLKGCIMDSCVECRCTQSYTCSDRSADNVLA